LDLGFEARAEHDQLGPITHQLTEFPDLRWGDPRFWDDVEAEHVEPRVGVAHVVLHPPVVPVQSERVRQVHLRPHLGENVCRPVPATGCLENDLGIFAGSGHCGSEVDGVVVDADPFDPLALLVGSHDERTTLVQIDCHLLSHGVSLH
jgi:hypothetical protein